MTILRVLIVEDHESWRGLLEDYINITLDMIGCEAHIHKTKSFDYARRCLRTKGPFHLMVTDIGLGKEGISRQKLGMRLVRLARGSKTPCIVVSGTPILRPNDVRILIFDHQIEDFFSKDDFDDDRFLKKVESILSRYTGETVHEDHERSGTKTGESGQSVAGSGSAASDGSTAAGAGGIAVGGDVHGSVFVSHENIQLEQSKSKARLMTAFHKWWRSIKAYELSTGEMGSASKHGVLPRSNKMAQRLEKYEVARIAAWPFLDDQTKRLVEQTEEIFLGFMAMVYRPYYNHEVYGDLVPGAVMTNATIMEIMSGARNIYSYADCDQAFRVLKTQLEN
jgi:DNA-binding response OmpR family regulator